MPNWCSNELTISGEKTNVVRFLEGLKALPATYPGEKGVVSNKPCYTLNSYVPVPMEIQSKPYSPNFEKDCTVSPLEQECGYNWQAEHWGTKWDAFYGEYFESEMERVWSKIEIIPDGMTSVSVYFETAWSPICPWVINVGRQFPDLSFELHYMEEGTGFGGVLLVEGEHVEDRYYDDMRLYQLAENRTDLADIVEDFYYVGLEYELEEAELNEIPDESDEEAYEEWLSNVTELLQEQIQDYFSSAIQANYVTMEEIAELSLAQIKECLAS